MTWPVILVAFMVPTALAIVVALPFWFSRNNAEIGNILGAGLITVSTLAFVAREFILIAGLRQHCVETGRGCENAGPTIAFTHYAVFACIGMFDVGALFWTSLLIEKKRAQRGVAKEWR